MNVLAPVVALALLLSACAAVPGTGTGEPTGTASTPNASTRPADAGETRIGVGDGSYTSVSPQRLTELLAAKDFVLVNVHVPYEGEIEATDGFIPFDAIAQRSSELPAAKGARIFLYCRSGSMSTVAATTLVGLGYTNVWELSGGMIAWEQAGYELLQLPQS